MKYIVEANLTSSEQLYKAITEFTTALVPTQVKSITELQPPPEVKKIETGVLMSPAEITKIKTCKSITFETDNYHSVGYDRSFNKIGDRLNISEHVYPIECYRDIQKTWDFASIPIGSLVEIVFNDKCIAYGRFVNVTDHLIYLSYCNIDADVNYNKHSIKSIRIIEVNEK